MYATNMRRLNVRDEYEMLECTQRVRDACLNVCVCDEYEMLGGASVQRYKYRSLAPRDSSTRIGPTAIPWASLISENGLKAGNHLYACMEGYESWIGR